MIAASLMLAVFVAIFARAGYEAYRDKRSDDACVGAVERKQRRIGTHARLGGGEIARRR